MICTPRPATSRRSMASRTRLASCRRQQLVAKGAGDGARRFGSVVEESFEGGGVEWTGKQEALTVFAVFVAQSCVLSVVFDAFGQSRQAKRLAELDECAEQGGCLGRIRDARDECPVDLDCIDGKLLKVGKRAVTRSEVVYRDANTKLLDGFEPTHGIWHVAHDRGLGDL